MSSQVEVEEETRPYKPGSIKHIKLINFMCHGLFELPLGPNVNFVIGPNGSGKSALLTALTVALGARATNTTRGKRASDFIKYGANWARVTVVLHNYDKLMNKDQAFKPEDYGKSITIEKTLYKDEVSKLSLKNDKDKKISERRQELDELLDHFGIVVNNPICILNQEISKTFLHSKKPEDKFDLFMKATNLEQIEQDYESAQESYKEWDSCIGRKNVAFSLLDKEYASCEEKVNFILNGAKLKELLQTLNTEFLFALDRDNEAEGKQLDEKVCELKKIIKEAEQAVNNKQVKIKKFEEEIQLSRTQIQSLDMNIMEARKKFEEIRAKDATVTAKQFEVQRKVENLKRRISRNIEDKNSLEKSIEDRKRELKAQDDLDNANEQRKREIEALEREIPLEHAREKSIRSHSNQLFESMTSVRADLQSANLRVTDMKIKQSQINSSLKRLRNCQENTIRKYGDHMADLRKEIDEANKAGRFRHKPVGPMGFYIKLKTPDVSGPLEIHLGKNAHAFVCDRQDDMNELNKIFKRYSSRHGFRQPLVIIRPFGARHDVSRFKAHHHTYQTLLDHIEITDDAVHNAIVDRCFLESVLYIPEYHLAEALMIDMRSVPKNTRMAYTRDCSVMYPRTTQGGYRSFAGRGGKRFLFADSNTNQIRDLERELSILEGEIRDAENVSKSIQTNMSVQRAELDQNRLETANLVTEIRKKEEKLLQLRTTLTVQPQELSALENEFDRAIESIASSEHDLKELKESLRALDVELNDTKKERTEAQNILRMHEKKRQEVMKEIDGVRRLIDDAKLKIRENEIIIGNREEELDAVKAKLDEILVKRTKARPAIQDCARPDVVRETEIVQSEFNKVQRQIEVQQEECLDPEELLISIRKRMEEIQHLKTLKDLNMRNLKSAAKSLSLRRDGFAQVRSSTIAAVSATFATVMRTMKMQGVLEIHLDDVTYHGEIIKRARTLEMRIDTNYTASQRVGLVMNENDSNNNTSQLNRRASRSQPTGMDSTMAAPSRPKRARLDGNGNATGGGGNGDISTQMAEKENGVKMTDCRSLSGGERSYSTVAFVLALWHHCVSPFKLMDEIDVFMDMVTRRVSYNALIRFAQLSEDAGQFIFFSPLELPKIDNADGCVRVFEMPVIVRKRPHSQINEAGDEPQE